MSRLFPDVRYEEIIGKEEVVLGQIESNSHRHRYDEIFLHEDELEEFIEDLKELKEAREDDE